LLLGRDRIGIKPMYWAYTSAGLIFGSECKTILESGWTQREMRPEALLDYMVQGYVGGADAAWSGIQRLPPSGLLSWEPGQEPRVRRTWDLPTEEMRGPAEDDEVLEWVDRVVQDRLESDVPLGAFLSGGVDSTAVVDSMARLQGQAPTVCSVGFQERSHDELEVARATAKKLGAVHHTEVLDPDPTLAVETLPWFYDEPLADPSTVPSFLVSKMAREHVTVALSGDGGDETFAGYRRYLHDRAENAMRTRLGGVGCAVARAAGSVYPKLDWAPRIFRGRTFLTNLGSDPAQAYWRSVTRMERGTALALLNPDVVQRLGDHDPFDVFEDHYKRPAQQDSLFRAQYADIHTYLPDQILAKVDRASMANSLEVRVPLLDHRFVERFVNLPSGEKISGGRGKHALRRALRSRLSSDILDGTKRGFDTPLKSWIRGPLAEPVRSAIEELPEAWFRRDALRTIFKQHQAGTKDHGHLLWSLLVLEHWRRRHGVLGLAR
jgi:asparagine synthase (glutamine-hydrolysing)